MRDALYLWTLYSRIADGAEVWLYLKMRRQRKIKQSEPRTRDRHEAEATFIEAAKAAFSEHGYDGATTRMIAQRAGLNLALINRYFGNKHGLLLELIKRGYKEDSNQPLAYPAQKTLIDECIGYVGAKFNSHAEHIDMFRIVVVQSITDPEFAQALRQTDFSQIPEVIQERFAPYLCNGSGSRNASKARLFVSCLDRIVFGSVMTQFLLAGETREKCVKDMKASVAALCEFVNQQS